jgi:hypothetical protein
VLKSTKIGDTQITYQDVGSTSASRAQGSPQALPTEVKALLRPYGTVPGVGSVTLVRT